jgi:hypothetical protein
MSGFHLIKNEVKLKVSIDVYTAFDEDTETQKIQRQLFNIFEALWSPYMLLRQGGATATGNHVNHGRVYSPDSVLQFFSATCQDTHQASTNLARQNLPVTSFGVYDEAMHISRRARRSIGPDGFRHLLKIRWGLAKLRHRRYDSERDEYETDNGEESDWEDEDSDLEDDSDSEEA